MNSKMITNNNTVSFFLIADENFKTPIEKSLNLLKQLYPKSTIYLYDWGLEPETASAFKKQHPLLEIIDWRARMQARRKNLTPPFKRELTNMILSHELLFHKNKIKKTLVYFYLRFFNTQRLKKRIDFENIIIEKLHAAVDCSKRAGKHFVMWLDADAFLTQRIDELIDPKYDFYLTNRRASEIRLTENNCSALNTGVMVWGPNERARTKFLSFWADEAEKCREYIRDQTSFVRIVQPYAGSALEKDNSSFNMNIDKNTSLAFKIVPCEIYNFNWIEELLNSGISPDKSSPKVLHFKGARHYEDQFLNLWNNLQSKGYFKGLN